MLTRLFSKIPAYTTTRTKCLSTSVPVKNKLKPSILYLAESHSAEPYVPPNYYETKSNTNHQSFNPNIPNSKFLPRKISMVESHSPQPWEMK